MTETIPTSLVRRVHWMLVERVRVPRWECEYVIRLDLHDGRRIMYLDPPTGVTRMLQGHAVVPRLPSGKWLERVAWLVFLATAVAASDTIQEALARLEEDLRAAFPQPGTPQ